MDSNPLRKLPISVTIITRNEEARISDAIRSVQSFASEIIVVDSHSSDRTVEIAQALGAKVVPHPFEGFGQQKNFAQSQATQEWVLNLDADERVSPELEHELRRLFEGGAFEEPVTGRVDGFYLPRKTWYLNRWVMHGGWYPNYLLRLARRERSQWTEPSLHEALEVKGKTAKLRFPLEHFSFPDQRSHILKNIEYAAHASRALAQKGRKAGWLDLSVRPIYKFFDVYLLKRGFLDGMAGFLIAVHSAYAVFLRYAHRYEETEAKKRNAKAT